MSSVAIGKHVDPFPHAMRVLRCSRTKRFFNGRGWSVHPSDAESFPSMDEAILACQSHHLRGVELVCLAQVTGAELFCRPLS